MDKLAYKALTDDKVGVDRSQMQITLIPDRSARTLTIRDNGVGMTKEELEANLGTIAKSGSLQFKKEMAEAEGVSENDLDIIGQFGVGFYSAFMVADKVTVTSKAYGSGEAWCWESSGADGYTLTPCEKADVGTEIVMTLKADSEEEKYDQYLDQNELDRLVKKYSDYVHYPIRMERTRTRAKEKPADAGEDYKTEYETYNEWETLNSMVPLWQRPKSEVKSEEYNDFYKEKYGDWEDPLTVIHVSAEGTVEYKAMLYIPSHPPYDFNSRDFEKGLQLYSSGVMIMDKCPDLVPNHFRFVRGVVDSADFSLNISREMLQHTRQLKVVANNLEKKIKAELLRIQKEDREKYETFWKAFGLSVKLGVIADYGAHKDLLRDLLLFWSSKEKKPVTLAENMSPACRRIKSLSITPAAKLPTRLPSSPRWSVLPKRATRFSVSPTSPTSLLCRFSTRSTVRSSSRSPPRTPSPRPTRRRPRQRRKPRRIRTYWTSSKRLWPAR